MRYNPFISCALVVISIPADIILVHDLHYKGMLFMGVLCLCLLWSTLPNHDEEVR